MKDKVFVFIIGLLVGAIITAAIFLILEKCDKNTDQMLRQNRMQMMERPDGEMQKDMQEGKENDRSRADMQTKDDTSKSKSKTM